MEPIWDEDKRTGAELVIAAEDFQQIIQGAFEAVIEMSIDVVNSFTECEEAEDIIAALKEIEPEIKFREW